jgi:hypothetical protein
MQNNIKFKKKKKKTFTKLIFRKLQLHQNNVEDVGHKKKRYAAQ